MSPTALQPVTSHTQHSISQHAPVRRPQFERWVESKELIRCDEVGRPAVLSNWATATPTAKNVFFSKLIIISKLL